MLTQILKLKRLFANTPRTKKKIISRSEHTISRNDINKNSLKVLKTLNKAGFKAYLVGGCIRDMLLGKNPKDFDIATNARPEEVRDIFRNCRLIGRRFRLAHVYFGREIIEVATFRSSNNAGEQTQEGMILRDNVYGTIEDDVMRRDFTMNALYYNIADFSVVDFVGGMQDIKNREIRLIGDPEIRYREDPVRMLRAIRFAAKLQFKIDSKTSKPIYKMHHLLDNIPNARLFEEYMKLFLHGHALQTFTLLREYMLFQHLFPLSEKYGDDKFISLALDNTDKRIAEDKSVAPSFLLAVMLWMPLIEKAKRLQKDGLPDFNLLHIAMDEVLGEHQKVMAVPRRFSGMIRDVWELQLRLSRRRRQASKLIALTKFRAAYDFLLLRAEAGHKDAIDIAHWWQQYVDGDTEERRKLVLKLAGKKRKKK